MRKDPRRERIERQARIDAERARVLAAIDDVLNDTEADDEPHDGVMVALFPSMEVARQLAVKGGEKASQLHVTLAYLGKAAALDGEAASNLLTLVEDFARRHGPLSGEVSGVGYFKNPEGVVTYASVDLPGLPDFRQDLVDYLDAADLPVSRDHGFTPHMTLAYADLQGLRPDNVAVTFAAVTVAVAGQRHTFALTGPEVSEKSATKKHKHKFIHPSKLGLRPGTAGWYGPGLCAACGRPESDPDHDGDTDAVGVPDADTAAVVTDTFNLVPVNEENPTEDKNRPNPKGIAVPQIQIVPSAAGYQINLYDQMAPFMRASLITPTKPHPYQHPASPDTKVPTGLPNDLMGISPLVYPPCALCGMMYGDDVHMGGNGDGDPNAPARDIQRAFLTEAHGKTMLTAPANVWERALNKNDHMMWMQGRFVGGETPNRNKALWSTKDLELGHPTVAHGPLNWLHEARHIIGTIADARMMPGSNGPESASTTDPHIVAMSAVWKWIYPDEAWVIENASDSGKLWYSMECISENVECVGDNGCGELASYGDYMQGRGCQHMREKSAVRRFDNPTFLGGAVIVPPVRPGWADADARVLQSEAASLAERTFEEVRPDLSTSEWELMMGEVLKYASV